MYEYTYVTIKTPYGNIKDSKLEFELNSKAKDGWRFVQAIPTEYYDDGPFEHVLVFEKLKS